MMLERDGQSNWAKNAWRLANGKNLGTIDASAYLIVLEGARCPNASESLESIPKIGRLFSNTRVFPEQTAYELLRPIVLFGDPAIGRQLPLPGVVEPGQQAIGD
jgi:hypothetical protein